MSKNEIKYLNSKGVETSVSISIRKQMFTTFIADSFRIEKIENKVFLITFFYKEMSVQQFFNIEGVKIKYDFLDKDRDTIREIEF